MKYRNMFWLLTAASIVLLMEAAITEVPPTIVYQGRLLDDGGQPVTDTVNLTFQIYQDSVGGASLWKEDHGDVPVTDGLFTVRLGLINGFGTTFDGSTKWLTVDYLGVESDPRMPIAMVPYAHRSCQADTARFAHASLDTNFVEASGDTMTGGLWFDGNDDGSPEGRVMLSTNYADFMLYDHGVMTSRIWGNEYGEIDLYHSGDSLRRAFMDAASTGGRLKLHNGTGAVRILLDARSDYSDAAVELPDDAINSLEIKDEPGIVRDMATPLTQYFIPPDSVVNLRSATIDVPGPGYVVALGYAYAYIYGNRIGTLFGGITEGASEPPVDGTMSMLGMSNQVMPEGYYGGSLNAERTFAVDSAGSYTYYFNAERGFYDEGDYSVAQCRLLLLYFPTSYGFVEAVVPPAQAGEFDDALPVSFRDSLTGRSGTVYKVDLRELELRVERERRQALEAELELERARAARERDQERD